ncbi:MAG TPA: alpha/beta hydrolase-fold protein, partial [Planctomycetaceae bacterium]|nr:alpha/beta hydrolase-fold protein [Planctomycetaceae bacterium]
MRPLKFLSTLVVLAAMISRGRPVIAADDPFPLGPDLQKQAGVPEGKITQHTWTSKIFEGTTRDYYVYVPAQYDGSQPAAVMVFQDGHTYVNKTGRFRVPIVFDNLIHKNEMPVTIGLFINPGHKGDSKIDSPWKANNRSVEYDTVSDTYSKFLLEEILPEVGHSYRLTDDPDQRAICGISSGGICAWTVAWERPDAFRKVLSHVGSFTNIRGGYVYSALIRKTENKPIRVFLQDGENDADNQFGNWWLANKQMEAALKFKGYEVKFVGDKGGHDDK